MAIYFFLIIFNLNNSDLIQKTNNSLERFYLLANSEIAYNYCVENELNTDICILVNMGKHSGLNRFYLWDFEADSIILKSPVSHGCGDSIWGYTTTKDSAVFSNVPESYCSSLGKYRIGRRSYSNWGINIHYKLHGLDSTNFNAFDRVIVLHSWGAVSDDEIFPEGTPEGHGCPAISNEKMKIIDKYLRKNDDILLWIFN